MKQSLETATKCTDCINEVTYNDADERNRPYPCEGCKTALCYNCYNKIGLCLDCEGC